LYMFSLWSRLLCKNFSKWIPGDTEIWHSVSATDCVRRTLYIEMTTSSLENVPFLAGFSELSILDCPFWLCIEWCPTFCCCSVLCFLFCFSSSCVLCTQCCNFLRIVHSWLPFMFSLSLV
jgi:hypothetical protein